MDSWSFNSVVKGLASDQSLSSAGAFGKDHIGSTGWEFKHPFIFGNNMGLLPNEINIENQVFGNINLSPLMKNSLFNPVMTASQNAFSEANESSCGIESKSMESGLIDLKLGSLIDQKEAQIFNTSKIAQNLSPSEVCLPSKRPRERGFSSSTPFCKVYGCNKNLSSCKEYHKRHKVCEVHSKTSKAIVNGIEQRFCQQCSRFHLLREFDDGKRSCRKRLAGHNERRRKPHVGPLSERHGRLLPSYNISVEGNGFKGTTGAISSFVIPNNLSSPYQLKSESNWEMNLEDRSAHDLQLISCITDEQLHSNSVSPCNFETNSGFINKCITASISSSESARSLLSSQSGSTSSHSSRIQTSNSQSHPMFPGSHDLNPMIGSEGSLVKFGIMNSDDQVFPDEGCTIDLLRLSSQLERVEHQKQKSQVNPANYIFHRKII